MTATGQYTLRKLDSKCFQARPTLSHCDALSPPLMVTFPQPCNQFIKQANDLLLLLDHINSYSWLWPACGLQSRHTRFTWPTGASSLHGYEVHWSLTESGRLLTAIIPTPPKRKPISLIRWLLWTVSLAELRNAWDSNEVQLRVCLGECLQKGPRKIHPAFDQYHPMFWASKRRHPVRQQHPFCFLTH